MKNNNRLGAMESIIDFDEHRRLEIAIARKFEKLGYKVKATHIGHPNGPPRSIQGLKSVRPDIIACKGAEKYCIEVITKNINKENIKKLQALSSITGYKLGIIAPKSNIDTIKNIAKENKIQYDQLWSLAI